MTIAECRPLVRLLTIKEMREFAADGLNSHLNGMCPEDQREFVQRLKADAKKREARGKKKVSPPSSPGPTFDNELV